MSESSPGNSAEFELETKVTQRWHESAEKRFDPQLQHQIRAPNKHQSDPGLDSDEVRPAGRVETRIPPAGSGAGSPSLQPEQAVDIEPYLRS